MSGLKPCPFCGEHEMIRIQRTWNGTRDVCSVHCLGCGTVTGISFTVEQAVNAWNTRADDEERS